MMVDSSKVSKGKVSGVDELEELETVWIALESNLLGGDGSGLLDGTDSFPRELSDSSIISSSSETVLDASSELSNIFRRE